MAGTASANWATATAGEVVSFAALQDTQHPDFLQEAAVLSAHFHVRRYVVVQLAPQQQHLIEVRLFAALLRQMSHMRDVAICVQLTLCSV